MIRLRFIFKYIFILIHYKKYVKGNEFLQDEIKYNMNVKVSKGILWSTKVQFKHLMFYYQDFTHLYFWRIGKQNSFYKWLFYPNKTSHCKIFTSTRIASGMISYHPFGTIINAKSIGENFIFRNNTTIGNKDKDQEKRPIIGDNVELGSNVIIIGDVSIGDNVTIGAGSVVVKDIPSNTIAAGNPAKVIKSKE